VIRIQQRHQVVCKLRVLGWCITCTNNRRGNGLLSNAYALLSAQAYEVYGKEYGNNFCALNSALKVWRPSLTTLRAIATSACLSHFCQLLRFWGLQCCCCRVLRTPLPDQLSQRDVGS
jgi:hypothetical protein